MIIDTIRFFFDQDIRQVHKEISLYRHEDAIWKAEKEISNSAGNLALHLIGNLNAYIGNVLAQTGYVRQRALEFTQKNVPATELLNRLEETRIVVEKGLEKVTDAMLLQPFPVVIWAEEKDYAFTLLRLSTHLNYHLGQINYHRRLLG